jgi:hypothetical protein
MRTNTGQQEPETEQSKFRHAALIAHASVLAAMLCMLLFTAFGSVQAQENKKIPRVGFLSATGESGQGHQVKPLVNWPLLRRMSFSIFPRYFLIGRKAKEK